MQILKQHGDLNMVNVWIRCSLTNVMLAVSTHFAPHVRLFLLEEEISDSFIVTDDAIRA